MEEKITLDPTTPRELQDEINHTKTETGAMAMVMEEWEKGMSRIFSVEKPREKLDYPMPTALELEQLKWIVITSANAEEVFAKLEAAGIDPVLFGLTDKDFELLAKNFAQIRQKLQETNNLLEEYKKYYEPTKEEKK